MSRIDITFVPESPVRRVQDPDRARALQRRLRARLAASAATFAPTLPLTPDQWFRALLRAGIVLLSGVLLFRALILEPVRVSTGSMVPAFMGTHHLGACPSCGISLRVSMEDDQPADFRGAKLRCFNCRTPLSDIARWPIQPGAGLFVNKLRFTLQSPQRWQPAVFMGPDGAATPLIKRIVGLPGETIRIVEGDIVADDQLARKSWNEFLALRVPLMEMRHVPREGWRAWWVAEPAGPVGHVPWVENAELYFPGVESRDTHWIAFRPPAAGLRELPLDDGPELQGDSDADPRTCLHDFSIECDLRMIRGQGCWQVELNDGLDRIALELDRGQERVRLLIQGRMVAEWPLPSGCRDRVRVEFGCVDRQVHARLQGRALFAPYELPFVDSRAGVLRPVRFGTNALAAVAGRITLFRDIHYRSDGEWGQRPVTLGPEEYFMLGDQSRESEDSRFWSRPGVPATRLIGKPIESWPFACRPR